MKNKAKLSPLLLAMGLVLGVTSITVGTAHAQAIVSSEAIDGSVELSNISGAGDPVPVAPEPDTTSTAVGAAVESPQAEPVKDPRESHRDLVMQVPEELPAGTSAASRRYRKVDRAKYNELMQGSAAQPAR
jgi:hypothetical protein